METDIVDFFFPDDDSILCEDDGYAKPANGSVSMHIRGSLYSLAFVNQKSTTIEGVRALKTDILRSLYGRCELHYDGMAVLEGEELDPIALHQFPRRVTAPLNEYSNLLITDYLFEGDVKTDAVASFMDLLDVETDPEKIEDSYEKTPGEETLEILLKSDDLNRQESMEEGIERIQAQFDEKHEKKGMKNKNTMIYFVLAVIMAILGYAIVLMFGK